MADGTTDWENMFGDELVLSEHFMAHSGTAGAQTPVEQPAASRATRTHVQRDVAAEELRDRRLEILATYDLTVDPRKFAIEQILAHSPANCNKDYKQMSAEEAASLHKADTSNTPKGVLNPIFCCLVQTTSSQKQTDGLFRSVIIKFSKNNTLGT